MAAIVIAISWSAGAPQTSHPMSSAGNETAWQRSHRLALSRGTTSLGS